MKYFLDLFSGIGGFALGAYNAGLRFNEHYFSEIEPYAIKVYQTRFPDAINLGDIRNVHGNELPKGEWIITGGFPCQDISVAGKGIGLEGKRSGLWYEYARIISELRPVYAIMENVGALSFRGLDKVLGSLTEIGYDAEWQTVCASDMGAPHKRERIWIVAYPNIMRVEREGTKFKTARISGKGENVPYSPSTGTERYSKRTESPQPVLGNYRENITRQNNQRRKEQYFWQWWETEPDVGRVVDGVPSRVDRLKCLGNSIVPQIAELIFEQSVFDSWRTA